MMIKLEDLALKSIIDRLCAPCQITLTDMHGDQLLWYRSIIVLCLGNDHLLLQGLKVAGSRRITGFETVVKKCGKPLT